MVYRDILVFVAPYPAGIQAKLYVAMLLAASRLCFVYVLCMAMHDSAKIQDHNNASSQTVSSHVTGKGCVHLRQHSP